MRELEQIIRWDNSDIVYHTLKATLFHELFALSVLFVRAHDNGLN